MIYRSHLRKGPGDGVVLCSDIPPELLNVIEPGYTMAFHCRAGSPPGGDRYRIDAIDREGRQLFCTYAPEVAK